MEKLVIKNVGPIEYVDIYLSRVNIFMGPQSSGKSTIAKIISYCQWVEKRFLIDEKYDYDVKEQLLEFHRLGKNYFTKESYFEYSSDFLIISYSGESLTQRITKKKTRKSYKKTKNIYIPSERNFVSAIPNLSKYKETNDNIMSFVYDWYSAKRSFTNKNSLSILNLGIKYYNNIDADQDLLKLSNNKEILLQEGSSGIQSILPLILIVEHLSKEIYKTNNSVSVRELDSIQSNIVKLLEKHKVDNIDLKDYNIAPDFIKFLTKYSVNNIVNYHKTQFIIEEPEQNLFPTTQRDLINYLLKTIVNNSKKHSLIITTHSPYILYSINNCLMGYNIKGELEKDEINSFKSIKSWINPDDVSIYEVKEGKLMSVKDKRTNTVTKHYFNEITKDIMDEYYNMLSFFTYEG
ncbi:ATP-binding protein [Chryseobacterium sp. RG1]|uniref:ATP-binding protein n=1 Tax=Chryseobacterium tagetis TaxID=2801334 RepID=A0ABS8A4F4_9FLAO|nr:AAA family ATPase [Chryseobacterium tagetis]MCA6068727.1 ATP-binding protein [Chryseobacterium tagetis]